MTQSSVKKLNIHMPTGSEGTSIFTKWPAFVITLPKLSLIASAYVNLHPIAISLVVQRNITRSPFILRHSFVNCNRWEVLFNQQL